jgi:hypothetical protein
MIKNRKDIYIILLLLLFLVIVIFFSLFKSQTIDIVIARYEEDLSWLKDIPIKYTTLYVYNKGSRITLNLPNVKIIQLSNLGRESHTYLYHAINNYNNLADMTFFLPGSVFSADFKKEKLFKIINSLKKDYNSTIVGTNDIEYIESQKDFTIDNYEVSNKENRAKNPDNYLEKSRYRPLNVWFNKRFSGEKITCMSYHGIMSVTKESIQKRPITFYKVLLEEHSIKNAEVVHYSERTWQNIFSIDNCIA